MWYTLAVCWSLASSEGTTVFDSLATASVDSLHESTEELGDDDDEPTTPSPTLAPTPYTTTPEPSPSAYDLLVLRNSDFAGQNKFKDFAMRAARAAPAAMGGGGKAQAGACCTDSGTYAPRWVGSKE